jgi:hypothetical protein
VNELDIVPCAWEPSTLNAIRDLYDPRPKCPPALAALIESIAEQVKSLDYAHLRGTQTALKPKVNPELGSFAEQMIHQHLNGYFEGLDLALTMDDFFSL